VKCLHERGEIGVVAVAGRGSEQKRFGRVDVTVNHDARGTPMARNSGVGAADERNRRRLKIIYKGQGQTIPLGWEEGGKENTKNRNETKQKKR